MNHTDLPSPFAETKPAPQRVPWNPVAGVLYVVAVFFTGQLFAALIALGLFAAYGAIQGTQPSLQNSIAGNFVVILLAEVISIAAIFWFVRRYRVSLATIGFKRPRWWDAVYALAAVPIYFIIYLLVLAAATKFFPGFNADQKQELGFDDVHGSVALIMTFISLVVLPPLAEEIMIRGFLYSSLRKAMKFVPAMIITSLIFAAAHLPEGGASGPLYVAALDTFVLSMVLVYLREKTGSLWPGIFLHAIKNGIAFMALFIIAK